MELEAYAIYLYMKWKVKKHGFKSISTNMEFEGKKAEYDQVAEKITNAVLRVVNKLEKGNPCLYRSAVGFLMFKRRKYKIKIALGIRIDPFESHAWLEFGGKIKLFEDHPENYLVLKR